MAKGSGPGMKAIKAYKNQKFLNSPDARLIRIMAEYLEPLNRFRTHGIEDTIVFFGSSRFRSSDAIKHDMEQLQHGSDHTSEASRKSIAKLEHDRAVSRYYDEAVILSRKLTATGIEAGGRSGLTAVVTAVLFLSALFFAPHFAIVPSYAFGPSLILVGMLMLSAITNLDLCDLTEAIPVCTIMILMSFTYNIGVGMTDGFVVYPLMKASAGKVGEVPPGLWVVWLLSLLFFVFYPYS